VGFLVALLMYLLHGASILPVLPKVDWGYVAAAVMCYSLYGVFYEMRYYYWSVGIRRSIIICYGLILFSLTAIPVYFLSEVYWMVGCILLGSIFYCSWLIRLFLNSKLNRT